MSVKYKQCLKEVKDKQDSVSRLRKRSSNERRLQLYNLGGSQRPPPEGKAILKNILRILSTDGKPQEPSLT